ncbi:MAG: type I DNA topoisomerase [Ignavibacteriaceae bacterium]|nr:type I DNA topoisomerase [Ignavibacterium sp.]MCC6253967.1 type I DNA topoisomerase [Ignavibacteriaceae bacterium]HMN23237.1 type I DNA topoisomerase [Ignavibacteriaceae bacterium]HRN26289.1 type I DNA topoisomerase [Ignavibacteriaceae bacterium]HRQ53866.1 type I DNA topoisomerase [Ignavibacteriaceae bacterium]
MPKNLVIVESPAKAKTIEGYLGKDFLVTSSYGHIRDLEKKNKGVDIENDFKPFYKISEDKKKVVTELKKLSKKAEMIWLATDEDREGEAISWHLKEALELDEDKIQRIVFNEITKTAILNAIKSPRKIDYHLVDAQQARRILDRLVGFEISGILWRKVKSKLSAGRVQSVAVRLIVEREREIDAFVPESRYKVVANFTVEDEKGKKTNLKAELARYLKDEKEAQEFLKSCSTSNFIVDDVEKKPVKKSPAAPFTTSTLQQEASRKLRYSVSRTMLLAQRLYEAGKITYMRTDSVNFSDFAVDAAEQAIKNGFGKEYLQRRQFKTKSKSAQEAHEAIRPTDFNKESVDGPKDENALYELIWKRAIASQMSDAEIERTTAKIKITGSKDVLTAKGEVIKFDGFLKVYLEDTDDENGENGFDAILPPLKVGQQLEMKDVTATERYTRASARYTEASLVKKLEELGIGRPSTYAPTISTIQKRDYVHKEERMGTERAYKVLSLNKKKEIKTETKTEITGADKGKLFPTDIAMLVTDFLNQHFPQIMDYQFTARVEDELDEIALGKVKYSKMLKEFYFPFHEKVEHTTETSERASGERILGIDPKTKKTVSVRMARFGPVAQLTDPNDPEAKPEYAGIRRDQKMELLTLEEALELFKLPRVVGTFEDKEIVAAIGRFGPYLRHDGKFYSLKKEYDPHTVSEEDAIIVIEAKRVADAEKFIKVFEEDPTYQILNGRWGPYLKVGKKNVKLPKDRDPASFTFEECVELEKNAVESKGKKRVFRKKKE